jgi:hypothetical protein
VLVESRAKPDCSIVPVDDRPPACAVCGKVPESLIVIIEPVAEGDGIQSWATAEASRYSKESINSREMRFSSDLAGLASNVDDLRRFVQQQMQRCLRLQFVNENLTFTGEDSPMADLMLSVLGAVAQFELDLIRERQREGIDLAKQRGAYRGRKPALTVDQAAVLRQRVRAGEKKALLAREYGISQETHYQHLRQKTCVQGKGTP